MIGGIVIDEFDDGVIDTLTVESVVIEVMMEVIFKLELRVLLGGMATEMFEDGTTNVLTPVVNVELVRGNGERG
jgi:hypothetical protein